MEQEGEQPVLDEVKPLDGVDVGVAGGHRRGIDGADADGQPDQPITAAAERADGDGGPGDPTADGEQDDPNQDGAVLAGKRVLNRATNLADDRRRDQDGHRRGNGDGQSRAG
jgi:hypothetical protein